MEYSIKYVTRILSKNEYQNEFDLIINLLQQHRIGQVELLFGFAWGNEYGDWTPLLTHPADIRKEIQKAQSTGAGSFGSDDLFMTLSDLETELLFCHENDVHLAYNQDNPIAGAILEGWRKKGLLHPSCV
ncbi:hypothetical protein OCK74_25920 [Chitinophagaceae bacterium LB-8]|uniref:Uncharacterized protein n=1 Tax=Paraflavisolibacter caeni TaxID=2982496 RepID=A0A9X2XPZ5_9BACT|nr:hypothetical protein [Paraflavisolibacter caeni]MCU7552583.1 hypothetical protein [Paraflavisolibacter caeni]